MKPIVCGAWLMLGWLLASPLLARTGNADLTARHSQVWQPAPPGQQLPLWPADLAIAKPALAGTEAYGTSLPGVAGRSVEIVEHVSRPTMTIYPPRGRNSGTAVVVFPGGGYRVLAIDLEGTEVCDWLTAKGVTCVVLKYRVPGSGPYWNEECQCRRIPKIPMALQDAQRAIALLRQRAGQLGVDPHKVGVIGFSAGGRMVADVSNHAARSYAAVDAADRQNLRPDFAIALYPGHLWAQHDIALDKQVRIDPQAPPTLIVQAGDDATDDVRESLTYYLALQQAGVPVELHLYPHGGHAFGVRPRSEPITHWTVLAEQWMQGLGLLPADAGRAKGPGA